MKKTLLLLALLINCLAGAQCVPTCTSYAVMPITYTTYPTTGNVVAIADFFPNGDDGYTNPVALGFNFNFYCTTYSNVLIYTNGLLQFNIGQPSTFPLGYDAAQLIPSPNSPTTLNGMVCFRMDDLDPSVGGTITYTTIGTSPNQAFVLTYSDVPIYGNPSLLNSGQIVLHETTNLIDVITIFSALSPNLATQGVEDQIGMEATAVVGRNQAYWSGSQNAYRFQPVTPLPPSTVGGGTLVCQGSQNIYTSATASGALSYSWSVPQGWTGSSTTTALTTTAGASSNLSVSAIYTCGASEPAQIQVSVVTAPVVSIVSADPFVLCDGTTFTITPSGGINYTVYPGPVVSPGTGPIVITSFGSATYSLVGSDATNCSSFNAATVAITSEPTPTVSVNSGSICVGGNFTMQPSGANSYGVTGGFLTVSPLTPGVYNYSVTGIGLGNNQCPSIQPAVSSLSVYAMPSLSLTTPNTIICKNHTITLTAGGADNYSWTGTGFTGSSISVAPQANTTYTVVGTTTAGCTASKVISIVVSPCTGISELTNAGQLLQVYPNPTSGKITVVFSDASADVEVLSSAGQLLFTRHAESGRLDIDLAEMAVGLYYVRLKGGASEAVKVVKE